MSFRLRNATSDDVRELRSLIARSAQGLSTQDYSPEQIEGALQGAFGVDSQLIAGGTYFVAESDQGIIGCGGWSKRRTLFGGDTGAARDASLLDPNTDAAKIRAFFVDPHRARQGIGRALLEKCEAEARAHGFRKLELMATLPGMRLYSALGYARDTSVHYELATGLRIEFVPMHKPLR